jgi:hypothetical protein
MKKETIAAVAASAASLVAGLSLASTNMPAMQTELAKNSTVAQSLPADRVNSAIPFDSDGSPYPPTHHFIG